MHEFVACACVVVCVPSSGLNIGGIGFGMAGTIPDSIGQLTDLTSINMYNNKDLTGTLPASLGQLKQLT